MTKDTKIVPDFIVKLQNMMQVSPIIIVDLPLNHQLGKLRTIARHLQPNTFW